MCRERNLFHTYFGGELSRNRNRGGCWVASGILWRAEPGSSAHPFFFWFLRGPAFSGFCEDPLFLVSARTRAGLAPESRYNRLHAVAEALESLVVVLLRAWARFYLVRLQARLDRR